MVVLNWGKRQTALLLAGSQLNYPSYFMIGSGTGNVSITQDSLVAATDRQEVTQITNPSSFKVRWQGDWNAAELSGLSLTEFGLAISGAGTTGSMWSRTYMPAITFDGTKELRIEETWEVI